MNFRITALDPAPFAPLFDLDDAALAARGARRVIADASPGFPCRASLADAEPGETLILVNYQHLPGNTPYAASHAVYLRQGAAMAQPQPGEVPAVLTRRPISIRAFDADAMMVGAELAEGDAIAHRLSALFDRAEIDFIHLHYARPGCFAAAVRRA